MNAQPNRYWLLKIACVDTKTIAGSPRFFARSVLLSVQRDAWDRCGERATPCVAAKPEAKTAVEETRGVVRGPAGDFRSGSDLRRTHLYSFAANRSLKGRGDLCLSLRAIEPESSFQTKLRRAAPVGTTRLSNSSAQPKQACFASATTSPSSAATRPCRPGAPTSYKRE